MTSKRKSSVRMLDVEDAPSLLRHRNVLIQWQGGGYDGCIWEPNTGYINKKGEWHPIISTGYSGRKTKDDLAAKFGEDKDIVYPITRAGLLEFQENIRDDFFMQTLKALEEDGYEVYWKCSQCGKVQNTTELFAEFAGYRGDGGIGIIHEGMVCQDCWDTGTCTTCGSFVDADDLLHLDDGQHCKNCVAEAIEDKATDAEREKLEGIDNDLDRFQQQVEDYCRLVPHAAPRAQQQAQEAIRDLEEKRRKLINAIVKRR